MLKLFHSLSGLQCILVILLSVSSFLSNATTQKCELLQTSLIYTQENAPRDLSDILPIIVEKVNRELEGVVDVEVLFTGGDMYDRVGNHTVTCSVTRLFSAIQDTTPFSTKDDDNTEIKVDDLGRQILSQCFQIEFTILDIDECHLPMGHLMRHTCPTSSLCINTFGSYECICPRMRTTDDNDDDNDNLLPLNQKIPKILTSDSSFWMTLKQSSSSSWEVSLPSSSCPQSRTTHDCCDANAHSIEGSTCRSLFVCPIDPCSTSTGHHQHHHDCDIHAICKRTDNPMDRPNYICECIDGLMGNGHKCRTGIDLKPKPMVMFDGITPTFETTQHGLYCGCSKPIIDPCSGFPKCEGKHQVCTVTDKNKPICACKPGFVNIEPYGCVDEAPPTLRLRHDLNRDGITRLKQGDIYKEYAVDIVDENAEDYLRSLKIAYSRPLPSGCITDIGSFQVNYTVATPWTSPPYVRVTRTVIIEDIDECTLDEEKYQTQCPELIPWCDVRAGAICVNTKGSYTCKCPDYTTGDGFKHIASLIPDKDGRFSGAPVGYKGGNSCRDTSKPIIQLKGPNPKKFRTCPWSGLSGIMEVTKKYKDDDYGSSITLQRDGYESEIKKMIAITAGAELCATHTKIKPRPVECVKAFDKTYLGDVDLSSRVSVGEPVQKSPFEWKIPYDVIDDAGNAAETAWRDVIVEEVSLDDIEAKIRREILANKDEEIREAVAVALEQERQNTTLDQVQKLQKKGVNTFANCPPCICPKDKVVFSDEECNKRCTPKRDGVDYVACKPQDQDAADRDGQCTNINPTVRFVVRHLEDALSNSFVFFIVLLTLAIMALFILDYLLSFLFVRKSGWYYIGPEDEKREKEMLNSVKYFKSPNAINTTSGDGSIPVRSGAAVGGGLFSPRQNRVYGQEKDQLFHEGNPLYNAGPITPSRSTLYKFNGKRVGQEDF